MFIVTKKKNTLKVKSYVVGKQTNDFGRKSEVGLHHLTTYFQAIF